MPNHKELLEALKAQNASARYMVATPCEAGGGRNPTQDELIRSLLTVVYPDMRDAAVKDLQTILAMERRMACNAYPRLVEVLDAYAHVDRASTSWKDHQMGAAEALLRELGEL